MYWKGIWYIYIVYVLYSTHKYFLLNIYIYIVIYIYITFFYLTYIIYNIIDTMVYLNLPLNLAKLLLWFIHPLQGSFQPSGRLPLHLFVVRQFFFSGTWSGHFDGELWKIVPQSSKTNISKLCSGNKTLGWHSMKSWLVYWDPYIGFWNNPHIIG